MTDNDWVFPIVTKVKTWVKNHKTTVAFIILAVAILIALNAVGPALAK